MRKVLVGLWGLAIVCSGMVVWAAPTSLDKDGMLRVDGKRTFIIGLYQTATADEFAKEIAAAGFNLIRVDPTEVELNRAKQAGLNAWIPAPGWAVENDQKAEEFEKFVQSHKEHPALAVWEGPDEILWNVWWVRWNQALEQWKTVEDTAQRFEGTAEERKQLNDTISRWKTYRSSGRYAEGEEAEQWIRKQLSLPPVSVKLSEWHKQLPALRQQAQRGTDIIRRNDPHHVIWFNHAPRNTIQDLTDFGAVADIVGCDIYPVPMGPLVGHSDLADQGLPSVGAYTRRMLQTAPAKSVWMVLQGFGWDDLAEVVNKGDRPRPTRSQNRFMAYDAIVNGARGILYWGTFAVEADAPFWTDLKQMVSELHSLQPFLSAPDSNQKYQVTIDPRWGSSERGLVWLAKEAEGQLALFLVNQAPDPIAFTVSGLDSWNSHTVQVSNEPETLQVQDGNIHYGLQGQSVSVLLFEK